MTQPQPSIRQLAAWLDDNQQAAIDACDRAMLQPGFEPQSTRDIVEAGYRLSLAESEKEQS